MDGDDGGGGGGEDEDRLGIECTPNYMYTELGGLMGGG